MNASLLAASGVLVLLAYLTFSGPARSSPARVRNRHAPSLEQPDVARQDEPRPTSERVGVVSFCLATTGIVGFVVAPGIAALWWVLFGCGSLLLLIAVVLAVRELRS